MVRAKLSSIRLGAGTFVSSDTKGVERSKYAQLQRLGGKAASARGEVRNRRGQDSGYFGHNFGKDKPF